MGRGFMAMMSAMAEDERLRIIKRTHEGRKIAQAKGVRMGRKPKLTPHQMKEARQRIAKGEIDARPRQELRRQRQHDFEASCITNINRLELAECWCSTPQMIAFFVGEVGE